MKGSGNLCVMWCRNTSGVWGAQIHQPGVSMSPAGSSHRFPAHGSSTVADSFSPGPSSSTSLRQGRKTPMESLSPFSRRNSYPLMADVGISQEMQAPPLPQSTKETPPYRQVRKYQKICWGQVSIHGKGLPRNESLRNVSAQLPPGDLQTKWIYLYF